MYDRYQPKDFENTMVALWQDKFVVDNNSDKPKFVMMMPPPNITGKLHMGHALNNTLQDSIARYKRMMGFNTLWLPGTDHASIATELKVVEQLKSQGIDKQSLGRDGFLQKCFDWKEQYSGNIIEQLKRLGCSVDWSRLAFTMDKNCNKAVRTVFVDLYNQGLIYKGQRIINWCVDCKTAISDAEVEYIENNGYIWHIKYPIDGGGHITIATTRPETMLGDTAVVVSPNDKRYKHLVGKYVVLPFIGRKIPILNDEYVDASFGTGAVKVTPAHDPNDFEIGKRLNLNSIKILTDDGKITGGTPYDGLERKSARDKIVEDLQALGLLDKVEEHHNSRGHCYRCNSVVEPMTSEQWFVKMQPLAEPAIQAVENGDTEFVPKSYSKIYMHWMKNIRDWCISRQLWWGHRIPAYYCNKCSNMCVSVDIVDKCDKCGGKMIQDEAVLDTWFSSALWPFSTLGFPDKTRDLSTFYPGSLLVTAYDIIFFWVARMMFSGLHHMGQVPFSKVLIHGIVRASDGRKMSKSLGNGVDPIDIIDNYGTDSLRFCLLSGVALGSDIRYSEERLQKAQAFCNKIYNAARFVKHNIGEMSIEEVCNNVVDKTTLTLADKWILSKLNDCIKSINQNFDSYEIGRVADTLYNFVWDDFCDWYIEISKVQMNVDKARASKVLLHVFDNILKLLHPIIPFITEYCCQELFDGKYILALQDFPKVDIFYNSEVDKFEHIRQLIVGIRAMRADNKIAQNIKVKMSIYGFDDFVRDMSQVVPIVCKLAMCSQVDILDKPIQEQKNIIKWNWSVGTVYMHLEMLDQSVVIKKLLDDKKSAEFELNLAKSKLNSVGFTSKAPQKLIKIEEEKVEKYTQIIQKLQLELEGHKIK